MKKAPPQEVFAKEEEGVQRKALILLGDAPRKFSYMNDSGVLKRLLIYMNRALIRYSMSLCPTSHRV